MDKGVKLEHPSHVIWVWQLSRWHGKSILLFPLQSKPYPVFLFEEHLLSSNTQVIMFAGIDALIPVQFLNINNLFRIT